jgi:hypothetical protein
MILKHTYDLSDEVLCERWVENPYYQFFCGEEFFQHRLVFDRWSLTRWRNRMGEERLQALLQESLSVATRTAAIKPSELSRVIVDTTVPRAVTSTPSPARTLGEIRSDLLRVECLRCFRIVEIQRLDAVRLYGPHAVWKDVGYRLLDDGCRHRTGRH